MSDKMEDLVEEYMRARELYRTSADMEVCAAARRYSRADNALRQAVGDVGAVTSADAPTEPGRLPSVDFGSGPTRSWFVRLIGWIRGD